MRVECFTAIDFETVQARRWSICQVGLVRVEQGKITHEIDLLVQPPGNYYWSRFTNEIHGISAKDTLHMPTFDKIWHRIQPFISHQEVVAHNGFGFDFPCLNQALAYYGLDIPEYSKHCTYKLFRNNLAALCRQYQIELKHHDALSDALACAKLFLMHNEQ